MLENVNYRSTCHISSLLDIIGDKWSLLIIRDIFLDRNTYSEFLKSDERIATNILVDRIKKLKSLDLIFFHKKPDNNKTKYYYLTNKGIDLYPVICEMTLWSHKYLNLKEIPPLGTDLINYIESKSLVHEISETVSDYQRRREMLLCNQDT
jgi:DNA-binding HxlR family transcriptional regulator